MTDFCFAFWIAGKPPFNSVPSNAQTLSFFLKCYGSLALLHSIFTVIRAYTFARGGLNAAVKIHDKAWNRLLRGSASFFTLHPSSLLINCLRCVKDNTPCEVGVTPVSPWVRTYSSVYNPFSLLHISADVSAADDSLPSSLNIFITQVLNLVELYTYINVMLEKDLQLNFNVVTRWLPYSELLSFYRSPLLRQFFLSLHVSLRISRFK